VERNDGNRINTLKSKLFTDEIKIELSVERFDAHFLYGKCIGTEGKEA
jgi:hypothetical protein